MKKKMILVAVAAIAAIAPIAIAPPLGVPLLGVAHADPGGYLTPDDEGCPMSEAAHARNPGAIWEYGCQQEKNNRCAMDSRCHVPGMPYPPGQTPARVSPPPANAPAAKPAVLPPPKGFDAPQQDVEAAKNAPATTVDPANPPSHPEAANFLQRVQDLIAKRKVDLVNANNQELARPRHWGFIDYDAYHRPALFNPLKEAMTFRYFYSGAYREVYVAAGARVVLNVAVVGVFPFTAVSDSYVGSGSFTGGAWIPPDGWSGPPPPNYTPPRPPPVYTDVRATVPATGQTIQVGQVTVVGHDGSQPQGSQDTFMLDDSTLAWGQADGLGNGGQITVARTQSLPGVGPIDNGNFLTALAAQPQPAGSPWPWVLGGAGAVLAIGLLTLVLVKRRKDAAGAREGEELSSGSA